MSSIISSSKEVHGLSTNVKSSESNGSVGESLKDGLCWNHEITWKLGSLSLNPNAEEFIPSALKSGNISTGNPLVGQCKDNGGKQSLDQTGSAKSNQPDDDLSRYLGFQLPDDLITDFDYSSNNVPEGDSYEDESVGMGLDICGDARPGCTIGQAIHYNYPSHNFLSPPERCSSARTGLGNLFPDVSLNPSVYELSTGRLSSTEEPLMSQENAQYHFSKGAEADYQRECVKQQAYNGLGIMQLNLLTAEFPNFALESLAEILYANQGDLMLTIEMLAQLEIQAGVSQQKIPATPVTPSSSTLDFPALSEVDLAGTLSHTVGADAQSNGRHGHTEFSTLFPHKQGSRIGSTDFAAIVHKHPEQRKTAWHYEKNAGSKISGGAVDRIQNVRNRDAATRPVTESFSTTNFHDFEPIEGQLWLETGDDVACIYSDMREEAHDHACVRNAYFEQARQAYLLGNKALAKELSAKGQYHNEQMKAAHAKAGEAIFRQRNASTIFSHSNMQGQSMLLDLHSLQVNEAILLLKRELAALKVVSRTASKRQQVFICVGTGHHTRGSRTPARLPTAVEKYLLEDERLPFTETEPGSLSWIFSLQNENANLKETLQKDISGPERVMSKWYANWNGK